MRRWAIAICALAWGALAAPAGAAADAGSAFYVAGVDDGAAGLPGDRPLYDLQGVRRWVAPSPFLTARSLAEARVRVNQPTGLLEVALRLTPQGARALRDYTGTHAGGRIAFVLDGVVLTAPVVVNRLSVDVIGIWDRTFDAATAERIAARIRAVIADESGRTVAQAAIQPRGQELS
ncbi:MAG TPA: hypothetical protein VMT68_14530 [Caulobacteraceae bacterium]|nr:hypothetical protein [Caulobacteraceae bacterium]